MRLLSRLCLALVLGGSSCGGGSPSTAESSAGGGGSGSSGSSSGSSNPSASGPQPPATTGSTSQGGGSTSVPTGGDTGRDPLGTSSSSGGPSCNASCGDGIVACGEECDCGVEPCTPEGLGFATCVDSVDLVNPDHVFTGGTLGCNAASCRFDFSACEWGCGDGIVVDGEDCEPELEAPSCAELGLGESTDPVPCDETCQLDTTMCR